MIVWSDDPKVVANPTKLFKIHYSKRFRNRWANICFVWNVAVMCCYPFNHCHFTRDNCVAQFYFFLNKQKLRRHFAHNKCLQWKDKKTHTLHGAHFAFKQRLIEWQSGRMKKKEREREHSRTFRILHSLFTKFLARVFGVCCCSFCHVHLIRIIQLVVGASRLRHEDRIQF